MLAQRNMTDAVSLLDSVSESGAGSDNGSSVKLPSVVEGIGFTLDVTAAAAGGLDSLAVVVQAKLDSVSGAQWIDVVAFTVAAGDGGAVTHFEKIAAGAAQAGFEAGTTLSAGEVRHLIGDEWRVRYTLAGGTAAFTFSVSACPM